MNEIQYRLVKGEKDKDIMRTVLLSERNYYKYKKKISLHLEEIQKERTESAIWLEVERIQHPHTKTSELSNLVSTAESIAINILKLESATITAIEQSNILESHVNTQLPTRSKYKELPKISYINNNSRGSEDLEDNNNNIRENKNCEIIYND